MTSKIKDKKHPSPQSKTNMYSIDAKFPVPLGFHYNLHLKERSFQKSINKTMNITGTISPRLQHHVEE